MIGSGFQLDPQLALDTRAVATLELCEVRLLDDSRFGWLLLVPRRAGAVEIHDLDAADQRQLWGEVSRCGVALRQCVPCEKMNLGALGNIVRQLHVHLVARNSGDAAWPGPVWGSGAAIPYDDVRSDALIHRLRQALDNIQA